MTTASGGRDGAAAPASAERCARAGGEPPARPLRCLLLCDYQPGQAATVCEHIEAFSRYSRHQIYTYSGIGELPVALDLDWFDAVFIHYSIFACIDAYLDPLTRFRIRRFAGVKALFIQDEYRFIDRTIGALGYLGIDILFTVVPEPEIAKVYPDALLPATRKVNVLTGYVSEALLRQQPLPLAQRPIEIGYRGRRYPAWHGELGLEKWRIGQRMREDAERYGLGVDISFREEDRLYGQAWLDFLGRTRAQLGVESGASVMDFTGAISERCEAHALRAPDTPYEELRRLYFAHEEGRIRLNQISPRIFEGLAMKALMILYDGEYSGLLEPWRHFVPLRKDHSNMDEVVATLRDLPRAQAIVDRAYDEVVLAPGNSYRAFIARVDRVLDEVRDDARHRAGAGTIAPGWFVRFEHAGEAASPAAGAAGDAVAAPLVGTAGLAARLRRLLHLAPLRVRVQWPWRARMLRLRHDAFRAAYAIYSRGLLQCVPRAPRAALHARLRGAWHRWRDWHARGHRRTVDAFDLLIAPLRRRVFGWSERRAALARLGPHAQRLLARGESPVWQPRGSALYRELVVLEQLAAQQRELAAATGAPVARLLEDRAAARGVIAAADAPAAALHGLRALAPHETEHAVSRWRAIVWRAGDPLGLGALQCIADDTAFPATAALAAREPAAVAALLRALGPASDAPDAVLASDAALAPANGSAAGVAQASDAPAGAPASAAPRRPAQPQPGAARLDSTPGAAAAAHTSTPRDAAAGVTSTPRDDAAAHTATHARRRPARATGSSQQ